MRHHKGKSEEATTLLNLLPKEDPINQNEKIEPNAKVYIDSFGRLAMIVFGLTETDCWLGVETKHVDGDQAPFCG